MLWESEENFVANGGDIKVDVSGNVHLTFGAEYRFSEEPVLPHSGVHYALLSPNGTFIQPVRMLSDSSVYSDGSPRILLFQDSVWISIARDDDGEMGFYRALLDYAGVAIAPIERYLFIDRPHRSAYIVGIGGDNSIVFASHSNASDIRLTSWTPNGDYLIEDLPVWDMGPCDRVNGFVDGTDSLQLVWRQYPSWQAVYAKRVSVRESLDVSRVNDYVALTPEVNGFVNGGAKIQPVGDSLIVFKYTQTSPNFGFMLALVRREDYSLVQSIYAGRDILNENTLEVEGDSAISFFDFTSDGNNRQVTLFKRFALPTLSLLDSIPISTNAIGVATRIVAYETDQNGTRHVIYLKRQVSQNPMSAQLYYRYWRESVNASPGRGQPEMSNSVTLFPNPFNSTLSISLDVPLQRDVTLSLYDLLGREVDVVYRGRLSSSTISYVAPAELSSGVYFLRAAGDVNVLGKVVLLK